MTFFDEEIVDHRSCCQLCSGADFETGERIPVACGGWISWLALRRMAKVIEALGSRLDEIVRRLDAQDAYATEQNERV